MKKLFLSCFTVLVLLFVSSMVLASNDVKIEVLYMNHGPLQASLQQIKNIFSQYGNKITVSWYDFESKEGVKLMAKKGVTQHIPLIIWVNGESNVPVEGREVKFVGFPTGAGPASFQGKWTMEELRKALDQIIEEK